MKKHIENLLASKDEKNGLPLYMQSMDKITRNKLCTTTKVFSDKFYQAGVEISPLYKIISRII